MKFSSVCSTLVLAAVAIAAPADLEARTDETVGHAQEQCSAGQVISCCNPSSTANKDGTLLGLLGLDSIFGNSCTGISAAVLPIVSRLTTSAVCGNSNSVRCCPNSQSGVVNVNLLQCSNI